MADIVTSRVFTDGERGITAQKLNDIIGSSVIQPAFYTSKPTAGSADPADIALILKAGAYAQVPISTLAGSATQAQIWSTRLRSINILGNPNFEVDQRTVGSGSGFALANVFALDRWFKGPSTLATNYGVAAAVMSSGYVNIPGTSFAISRSFMRFTVGTQKATLAAGDVAEVHQYVEGPQLRELINDVHSISLLVRSNVAPLSFAVNLRDSASGYSLVNLLTVPTANTWTVLTLPNLPVWTSSGNFPVSAGSVGYFIGICLASGTTFIAPSTGVWGSGNFYGAPGMSNWVNSPVNSTFDIAFVQHEPGAVCSTLMDKPFSQNLGECLRYFQKSYPHVVAPGTATSTQGEVVVISPGVSTPNLFHPVRYGVPMAISNPTVTIYAPGTGAINNVLDASGAINRVVSSVKNPGSTGFGGVVLATNPAANSVIEYNYTADTGW